MFTHVICWLLGRGSPPPPAEPEKDPPPVPLCTVTEAEYQAVMAEVYGLLPNSTAWWPMGCPIVQYGEVRQPVGTYRDAHRN